MRDQETELKSGLETLMTSARATRNKIETLEGVARAYERLLADVESAGKLLGYPGLDIRMAAKASVEKGERAASAMQERCAKAVIALDTRDARAFAAGSFELHGGTLRYAATVIRALK